MRPLIRYGVIPRRIFALGLMILVHASIARAEVFFGITDNGIFSADTVTGGPATQVVTFVDPINFSETLAVRPSDGMLFYFDSQAAHPRLWRWNPNTPSIAPVIVGTPGANASGIVRLGFNAAGTLYAMNADPNFPTTRATLWTLNSNTGAVLTATPVSGSQVPSGGDICVQPNTGILYMVARIPPNGPEGGIYTITSNGVVTFLGPIGSISVDIRGCAFDSLGRLAVTIATAGAPLRVVNIGSLTSTPLPNAALPISPAGKTWGDLATAPSHKADIRLANTASNLTPGASVTLTVSVTNDGSSVATDVRVLDQLPAGLTLILATPSQGSYTQATGIWQVGTLNSGANATLTLNANVTGTMPMTHTAQVSYADLADPDSIPNNSATGEDDQGSVTLIPSGDLQIVKTATLTFVVGVNGSYTLTVNNILGSLTTGTNLYTVTDNMPTGLSIVGTPNGTGWNCSASTAMAVNCTSTTAILAGATSGNPINVTVLPAANAVPSVINTAQVSGGGEPVANSGNNSSTITTVVCAANCSDVRVGKSGPASFTVGTNAPYILTANNTLGGLATFGSYTITDNMPTGLAIVGTPAGAGWNCSASTATAVNCISSTVIAPGGSNPNAITVNVSVANAAVPSVNNTAAISGGGEPSAATNNNATSLTTPVIDFDLTVTKTSSLNFALGGNGSYTITVNNIGGAPTTAIYTVTDTLPAGLAFVSATGTGWGCGAALQVVTCTRGVSIAANASAPPIALTVLVADAAVPNVTNTARVSNPNEAVAHTNNNSTATTTPVIAPDLLVTKTHSGNFTVGINGIYTIAVSNIGGQNTTKDIIVTDTLPTGLTFVSAVGSTWQCSAVLQVITCKRKPAISANKSAPIISLTVAVTAAAVPSVINGVTVSGGGEPSGNAGNNADNVSNDVTSVFFSPSIAKSFLPTSMVAGTVSRLTLTITNPASNTVAIIGVAVVDPFPLGMSVAAVPDFISTCGGSVLPGQNQGDTMILLTGGGPVAIGANCTIAVNVTSSAIGANVNTTGQVSSSNSGTGNAASATLTVTSPGVPVVTKLSSPNPAGVNQNSLMTFTIINKLTPTSDMGFTDTLPDGVVVFAPAVFGGSCTSTGGAALSRIATAGLPTITVSGVDLTGSTSCTITLRIVSAISGAYLNDNTRISGLAGGLTANVNDTLNVVGTTLTKAFQPVFIAANAVSTLTFTITNGAGNPQQNGLAFTEELPTGVTVVSFPLATQCNGAVTAFAGGTTIVFTGGSLALTQVFCDISVNVTASLAGSYLNDSARVSGLSANITNNVNATLTVTSGVVLVTGRVFKDTGDGVGAANDGVQNGGETGISNVAVRLTNCAGTTYSAVLTVGGGDYTLTIPNTLLGGTTLCVTEFNPSGFISTGGGAGSTGGAYSRSADSVQFTYTLGVGSSGVNFADVPENQFLSDGTQTVLPGSVAFYTHTFIAGTGGQAVFSIASISTPAISGWSEVIYHDSNCNGSVDAGESIVSGVVILSAGERVCLVVKEMTPANGPSGAQNQVTVTAQFTYTNAIPLFSSGYSRTDLTLLGMAGLAIVKVVNKDQAFPGETLTYTITYTNNSSDILSAIKINDATPVYTTFNSAACGVPLPSNLTACMVTVQPSVGGEGAIEWTFVGTLISSGNGQVTYTVTINP